LGHEHVRPHGYLVRASWNGSRALEWEVRKNGAVEGRGRYQVWDDDRTMTLSTGDQRFVFERVSTVN
jgi:hypothetical protein